jgi:cytochrome c peroxidase
MDHTTAAFSADRNDNLHSQDGTMRYWLLILFSFAVGGVTLWQLRFLNAGSITQPGPRSFIPKEAEPEISRVEREVDEIEQQALAEWRALPINSLTRMDQVRILGKLLLFDKNLSVNRNEACSFCHMPSTDFTGPISILNQTTVAYPGSVRTRIGHRKPQSYTYSPFFPVLRYNSTQQDFYGGNFWDLRATGYKLQNPAAEQAQGPPVDPNEMGLPDSACVVRRLSESPYRPLFETVWGEQAFAIRWPADVERVCSKPGPASTADPYPVHLGKEDRGRSNATYDQFGLAIAMYEASPEVSPFTSKFDYALAHADEPVLSPDELAGWNLFRSRAKCNTCHLDGTENTSRTSQPVKPGNAASVAPLFTDFTSNNIGVPRNPAVPYYSLNEPDQYGYVANPAGERFVDRGVGDFLRGPDNINSTWKSYAKSFDGKFQTSTLRNVDKRPRPDFVKAYMHNGYLKSLKEVVHFYNTRDTLGLCRTPSDPGQKISCWPAPEVAQNLNTTIGRLGLTDHEEDQIVAFLTALTDGYKPAK